MKLRDKLIIALVLIIGFATAMFFVQPKAIQPIITRAASDYVNTWLRTNVTNSSDGYSLLVEFTPNSSLTGEWASTNTVEDVLDVERTSSGTPSAGIGTGVTLSAETSVGNVETGLTLDAVTTDVTGASEDFDFTINLMDGGSAAAERWRTDSGGIITQSAVSAATNAVVDVMNIKHNTSGTEANGIGLGILFTQEVTSGDEIAASVDVSASDVTAASEDFSYIISLMSGGSAAAARWTLGSTGLVTLVNSGTIDNTTDGIITLDEPSAATNAVVDLVKIAHTTSGTAAAGIGNGLVFEGEDDGGATQVGMSIDMVSTDVTAASEDYDFVVGLMDGGTAAAERWRTDSGGIITQSAVSAATNAVIDVMNIKHNTSGVEDDGIGLGILFTQETGAVDEILASIDVVASDVTGATEDGEIIFSTMTAGAAATEKMRVHDSGEVEFQMGIVPDQVTADPCGSGYPEGSIFYNSTDNILCYCSAAAADLKVADDAACF